MADIGRATLVLDAIAESNVPLSLAELAARTGLPRSTVHRIIQALERELYVVRPANRSGYILGTGLLKFGMNAHLRLLAANRGDLALLARTVNENVELAVFSGREAVVVDQIASLDRLRGVSKVGKSFSLHASSIGIALLAQLPDVTISEILPPTLERFTDNTITDLDALMGRIELVRSSHIALDIEEHDMGICAIATGMVGPTGAVQATCVVIPTHRFKDKVNRAVEGLKAINGEIMMPSIGS